MTDTSATIPYDQLRERQVADLGSRLPGMLDRLSWPGERLAAHRTAELRRLLRGARDASPWHRERLAGVDLDTIDESDLTELPVMTKDDLMENFDAVVTDERLTLHAVEEHLAGMTGDGYVFDRYLAAASGGSSGRRGLFVYDKPCACGGTHRRITDPYGRLDDVFAYGDRTVHPRVFRSPLSRHRAIVEYQVRQSPAGASIRIVVCDDLDIAALAGEITAALGTAGLPDPCVDVQVVERLPRPPSGKLRRFVPTEPDGA